MWVGSNGSVGLGVGDAAGWLAWDGFVDSVALLVGNAPVVVTAVGCPPKEEPTDAPAGKQPNKSKLNRVARIMGAVWRISTCPVRRPGGGEIVEPGTPEVGWRLIIQALPFARLI